MLSLTPAHVSLQKDIYVDNFELNGPEFRYIRTHILAFHSLRDRSRIYIIISV